LVGRPANAAELPVSALVVNLIDFNTAVSASVHDTMRHAAISTSMQNYYQLKVIASYGST